MWVGIVPFGTVIAGCFYMKRIFAILLSIFTTATLSLADDVTIDKDNCTITKDGRTYPLYGEVKFVDEYPDITIKFVDAYADIEVKITDSSYQSCCEWKVVDSSESYPDLRVKVVRDYPDITVRVVTDYPHIR